MDSKNFENTMICLECGGRCCKQYPGAAYPEDFILREGTEKFLITIAIKSKKWVIDWWEGDPGDGNKETAYFVRPAIKGKEGKTYDPSWGGECIFLEPTGCSLQLKHRPRECRLLEPKKGGKGCVAHDNTGKNGAALAWRNYFEILNSFHED